MRRLVMGLITLFGLLAMQPARAADVFPDIVQGMKASIVGIGTVQPLRRPPLDLKGTGFVVHDGRHVVTNFHVLPSVMDTDNKERLVVIVGHARNFTDRDAEIVAMDPDHDLALLRISGDPLPPVKLGSGALLRDGTRIAITGYPIGSVFGVYPVTHVGHVAAITPIRIPQASSRLLDARMILRNPFDVYQLDITAFPGNSGSPMYDAATGRVEAVLNSTFIKETKERALSEPTGISFAIPVVYVHEILRKAGLTK